MMNENPVTILEIDRDLSGVLVQTPLGELALQFVLGADGTPVIYVDTPDYEEGQYGPKLRIWVNDETVFEGVPVPDASYYAD